MSSPTVQNYHLAIGELVIYAIILPLTMFVFIRHLRLGAPVVVGWFYAVMFPLSQVIANIITIANGKDSVSEAGIIITQVGLGPLMLALMGLLHERNLFTPLAESFFFKAPAQIIFHGLLLVATGILAAGGVNVFGSDDPTTSGRDEVRAGVILYLAIWVFLVFLCINSFFSFATVASMRKLLVAIAFVMVMILLRLIYTLLAVFDTSVTTFMPIGGSIVARILLEAIPLNLAAYAYTIGGLLTVNDVNDRQWTSRQSNGATRLQSSNGNNKSENNQGMAV